MTFFQIITSVILLVIIELLYFKAAVYFNITDRPNLRSSHTEITIRGGGIIFPVSLFLYAVCFGFKDIYFLSGLFLISLISFADDIKPVNNKFRLLIHLIAVGLLLYQLGIFILPVYIIIMAFFFTIGTINAVNFMDGINGITGGYSLITLISLFLVNQYGTSFTNPDLLLIAIIAVTIFNFFNFRKKARCFAGDAGSVSIGFIILYFILLLVLKTENPGYILLLLVYGLDVVTTICFRLLRKEKLMEAHRSHFYQYLSNEKGISQLVVASIYILIQVVINLLLIINGLQSIWLMLLVIMVSGIVFVKLRFDFEGTKRLLG